MTDLEALRGLCDLLGDAEAVSRLRAAGLASVRAGTLELHFGPSVPPSLEQPDAEISPVTERAPQASTGRDDDERNALELLLNTDPGEADALLEMQQKARTSRAA